MLTAAAKLIGSLVRAGGHLRVTAGGGLKYVGPANILTDDLRSEIRNHKDAIATWLETPFDLQSPEDQLELDYERTLPESWFEPARQPETGPDDLREFIATTTAEGATFELTLTGIRLRGPDWIRDEDLQDHVRANLAGLRSLLKTAPVGELVEPAGDAVLEVGP